MLDDRLDQMITIGSLGNVRHHIKRVAALLVHPGNRIAVCVLGAGSHHDDDKSVVGELARDGAANAAGAAGDNGNLLD